ncbi:MAG: hydrolase [Pseudonocardiales bacterium]|nr:hydrolase [Pseudonocardiales bacterium]
MLSPPLDDSPPDDSPADGSPPDDRRAGTGAAEAVRRAAIRVAALAQNGLTFSTDPFDIDRFEHLRAVAAELLMVLTDRPAEEWKLELGREIGYVTPKVEVRGVLVDDQDRLLLMRETVDGRWSLPGGFADPIDTPSEAVVREVLEETGYGVEVVKLIGCWDRDRRGHRPRLTFSIYKLFFLCRATGEQQLPAVLETLEIGWFGIQELPELSPGRVNRWELERALAHHREPSLPTEFD